MVTDSPLILIHDGGEHSAIAGSHSYRQLVQGIHGFSTRLVPYDNFATNDPTSVPPRILITGDNSPAWIMSLYASLQSGYVAVPVDTQANVDDLAFIIADCQPAYIFTSRSREPAVHEALAKSPAAIRPNVLVLEDLAAQDYTSRPNQFSFRPALATTALIIYTSGTTGSPKGVMLSYGNLLANMAAVTNAKNPVYRLNDRIMMLLPVHHIFPLMGTLMVSLYVGATIVMCPAMHGEAIMRTLNDHQVTIMLGVPRLYSMIASGIQSKIQASLVARALFAIASRLQSPGFSRALFGSVHRKFGGALRIMVSGGAALDPAVARVFTTLGFDLVEGYGMTEAAPMITFTRPGTLRPGSPGQVLDGVEIAIRDDEICARGPNVMQGYFGRPEETRAILQDGWLHTGDLGSLDADGYLHISGRRKEIIVLSNGKNINPGELETALEAMSPFLKEVAVYQDHDRLRALAVLDTQAMDAAGIAAQDAWLRETILKPWNRTQASYRSLAGILISTVELPRTRLGKLRRFQLPALAATLGGPGGSQVSGAAQLGVRAKALAVLPEFVAIRTYLQHEKQLTIKPGDHLFLDLGLDSLDVIGFQAFLESSFGIEMPLEKLGAFETAGELAEHLAASKTRLSVELLDWAKILATRIRNTLPKTWFTAPLVTAMLRPFLKFWFRLSSRGLANIPDGPCIIVPNHQSYFDGFFISAVLRLRQLRKTFFYAKASHIRGGFLQRLAQLNNIIVLDINHNLKDSILRVAEVLRSQRKLIIFPEGTRTSDGRLGEFKKMFAILSRELQVPIVPVSIRGAWEVLPRGASIPKLFRPVRLDFLPAIPPGSMSYDELTGTVRAMIERKLSPA